MHQVRTIVPTFGKGTSHLVEFLIPTLLQETAVFPQYLPLLQLPQNLIVVTKESLVAKTVLMSGATVV